MDGELRLVSRDADPTDPLAKLKAEGTPMLFSGQVVWAACYKTRPCVLPFGSAIKRLFKFVPDEFSLVTLLGYSKRVTRPRGETRND